MCVVHREAGYINAANRSPGPTQRFQEFIETYAASSDPENRNTKRLYRIRSNIAHGRDLLHFDSSPWDWSSSTTSIKEQEALDELFGLTCKITVNWLQKQ